MLGSHATEYARWHYERVSNKGEMAAVEIRHHTTTVQGVCGLALPNVCNGGCSLRSCGPGAAARAYRQDVLLLCMPYCYPNH